MRDRINRILDLVQQERLGADDAAQLLEALSPRLALSAEARPHLFALLSAPDYGVERVTEILELRVTPHRPRVVVGGRGVNLDDLPERIGTMLDTAFEGAFRGRPGKAVRPGALLRVEVQDADGSELRANLPLALAEHAHKILPPRVMNVLAHEGLSPEGLQLMLSASPPAGELLSMSGADGSEIRLTIE